MWFWCCPYYIGNQISSKSGFTSNVDRCDYYLLSLQAVLSNWRKSKVPVTFSLLGDWLETSKDKQVAWVITDKSRVSSLLLFVHLISPVNSRRSKWCLIFKDQVTERDFRRLSRAVIYQQQTVGKN